jgi:hypothetical protein
MSTLSSAQFARQTRVEGGASRSLHDSSVPEHGYAVGGLIPEEQVRSKTFNAAKVDAHKDHILKSPVAGHVATHQGSWIDPDQPKAVILDASSIHASKASARLNGLVRGEKAIYDLNAGKDINLPHKSRGSKVYSS